DKEAAATTYKVAVSAVDRAAGKNLIHKNNAAHKKSAMDKKMNEMA
ncbi:MAG: 30S ribosomal protein S20, partial [Oscillospiraceae bacterium]|nr:30S ribosomal protein S20 [Oscillospiraceae bacterium]